MFNLFKLDSNQIECLRNFNYKDLKIDLVKIEYARMFMTFAISMTKIGGTFYYIEVLSDYYQIFEEAKEKSFLRDFIARNYKKVKNDKKLLNIVDLPFEEKIVESWMRDDKTIFYIDNYFDPSINQLINIVVIPR
jgi:hypothetical protein